MASGRGVYEDVRIAGQHLNTRFPQRQDFFFTPSVRTQYFTPVSRQKFKLSSIVPIFPTLNRLVKGSILDIT